MVAHNKRKVKRRKGKKSRKRSIAAKKGWETRRKKQLGKVPKKDELEKLRRELEKAQRQIETLKEEIEELRVDKDEAEEFVEEAEDIVRGFFELPETMQHVVGGYLTSLEDRPKEQVIRETLDFYYELYGKGPGLYDIAYELADRYEMDMDEVFDLWDTPE